MNLLYKINVVSRVIKSIFLKQKPNYAIIYIDGRCNMHCGFCIHAAVDARKTPIISPKQWGLVFKKAKSLLHLTITGGEPFLRKDFVQIIDNIILNCNVPKISIKSNGFYVYRIKKFISHNVKNEDFVICEIGGTVGDIESLPFLEAIRQFSNDTGKKNSLFIHLTLVPYLKAAGE